MKPADPTRTADPEHRALRAIRRILHRVSSHSRSIAKDSGLTLPQLLCLRAIAARQADAATLAAVADDVQLSPSTVSGIVDRLVRSGLVLRERSTQDRRRICLSVSADGHLALRTAAPPLQDLFLARLHDLPSSEREALLASLERVVELMDAGDLDAAPMLVAEPELT